MSDKYEVITFEDNIAFNYTLPDDDKQEQINREVTIVWEETLEKFFETYGAQKPYEIHSFENEKKKNRFVADIEDKNEKIIDEVDEEISLKMKFVHAYTSPTYED